MEEKKEIGYINNFYQRNNGLNSPQYVLLKNKLKKKEGKRNRMSFQIKKNIRVKLDNFLEEELMRRKRIVFKKDLKGAPRP